VMRWRPTERLGKWRRQRERLGSRTILVLVAAGSCGRVDEWVVGKEARVVE